MKKKLIVRLAIVIITLSCWVSEVNAALLSYSNTSSGPVNFGWWDTLSLPLFKPTTGYLNSITFDLSGSLEVCLWAYHYAPEPHDIFLFNQAYFYLQDPTNFPNHLVYGEKGFVVDIPSVPPEGRSCEYYGGGYVSWNGSTNIVNNSANAIFISNFLGTGVVELPYSIDFHVVGFEPDYVEWGMGWAWGEVTATTTYDYTPNPLPEPATMLLFGTGIAGFAGSRLRRKK